jgi:hypothetical protein
VAAGAVLWLYRFEVALRVQAGGRPLVRANVRLRIFGLVMRREWNFGRADVSGLARWVLKLAAGPPEDGLPEGCPAPQPRAAPRSSRSSTHSASAAPLTTREILEALSLRRFSLKIGISTGDAAQTAVVCGFLNAAGGIAVAGIKRLPHLPPRVAILAQPLWRSDQMWRVDLRCIANPRLSQAIFAAWRLYCAFGGAGAGQARARFPAFRRRPRVRLGEGIGTLSRARRG